MGTSRLHKRIIIVAGAGGGIGSATCRLLQSQGATVVALCRTASQPDPTEVGATGSLSWLCTDLRSPQSWRTIVQDVRRGFGRIDVLVNCIGKLVPGSVGALTDDDVEDVVATNILGVVSGVRAVLPQMRRQRCGHIITIGSIGGIVPMPHEALYCATKFAVRGFMLSLSRELEGTGVQVSLIAPGPVRTKMLDREAQDDRSTISFVSKPLDAESVAQAVLDVICLPTLETVVPRGAAAAVKILGLFPRLFERALPLLNAIGEVGLERYRQRCSSTSSVAKS